MLRPRLSLACIAALSGLVAAQPADDAAYRAATGLLHRDMPKEAAAEYRAFLRDHPTHARADNARYGLAVCLTRLGQWDEAAAELDTLASRSGFEFAADCLLLRAQCHLFAKEQSAAALCLQSLLRDHPQFAQADAAAAMLGEILARDGKKDDARAVLSRFEREWPKSASRPRVELLLAALDASEGRDKEAADRLAKLRRDYPGSEVEVQATLSEAQSRHRLAVAAAIDPRETERAAKLYRSVAEGSQKDLVPEAMLGLGQLTRASGDAVGAGRILDDLLARSAASGVADAARIERARAYLDEDKAERALSALEPVLRAAGPNADASYWAAKAEMRLGRFAAAADRLEKAAALNPKSPLLPEMLFDRAVALARDNKAEEAGAAYARVRSQFSKHPLAAESLAAEASLALAGGKAERAVELGTDFLAAHPKHARASAVQLVLAEAYALTGKEDQAAAQYAAFASANAQDPRAVDAMLRRGLAMARADKPEASEVLERALATPGQIDPTLQRAAISVLADAAMSRSDWKGAERWLTELAKAEATPDSLLKLGIALQRQGRPDDSLDVFARVIRSSPSGPESVQARFERGQILVEQGKLDEARADFEAVIAAEQGQSSGRFTIHSLRHLASIASRQNRAEDAAALLAKVADSPDAGSAAADAMYERGAALLAAGQYEEAEAALAKFLSTSPSHPRAADAAAQQAIATSRLGKHEQALTRMEAADSTSVRPEVLGALRYEKAWVLKTLGKSDEARAAYERLLTTTIPPSLESHAALDLAQINISANQHAGAVPLLSRSLRVAEKLTPAETALLTPAILYLRGVCELKLDKPAEAGATLEDLVTRFPKSDVATPAQLLAGQALLRANKPEAAIKHLQAVMDAKPADATLAPALLALGEACAAAQQWEKSRAAFERHLKQFPDSEFWFQSQFGIAWSLEHEGRHPEAISAYREVIARHEGPTTARAQFQVGECHFALKQYEDAVRELLKVDILYAYPEWSAAALYEAGRCLVQLNKGAEARTQFAQVTERFKDTQWARLAAEQLQRLGANASTLPGRAAAESR